MAASTPSKKVLLIFDLNRVLLTTVKGGKYKTFDMGSALETRKPDHKTKELNIYFRSGRNEFLDFLFIKNRGFFEIAVWSSLDKDYTSSFTKLFFERYYRNLLFISATRREEYEGIKNEYTPDPIPIKKDLSQVFNKFPDFEMNNTIVVSPFKNLIDIYTSNDLIMKPYDPNIQGFSFETDFGLQGLSKFLRGCRFLVEKNRVQDIRTVLATKSLDNMLDKIANTTLNYNKFN